MAELRHQKTWWSDKDKNTQLALLKKGKVNPDEPDEYGHTLIVLAIWNGDAEMAKTLLDAGARGLPPSTLHLERKPFAHRLVSLYRSYPTFFCLSRRIEITALLRAKGLLDVNARFGDEQSTFLVDFVYHADGYTNKTWFHKHWTPLLRCLLSTADLSSPVSLNAQTAHKKQRLAPLKFVEALGRNDKAIARVLLGLKAELVRAHCQRIALHGLISFNMPQNAIQIILKNIQGI